MELKAGDQNSEECHELEPSAAEDPPCRGVDLRLNCLSGLKHLPVGVVWTLEVGSAQVSSSSLDHGSKLRDRHQKPSCS
ncbi:hypothetical protein TNCV_545901 [Trichonephila clavipes]|nr:hypothetical protein TNCV_545901 [Trichonephila clavipes]